MFKKQNKVKTTKTDNTLYTNISDVESLQRHVSDLQREERKCRDKIRDLKETLSEISGSWRFRIQAINSYDYWYDSAITYSSENENARLEFEKNIRNFCKEEIEKDITRNEDIIASCEKEIELINSNISEFMSKLDRINTKN